MHSEIGSSRSGTWAVAAGLAAVGLDLYLSSTGHGYSLPRWAVAIGVTALLFFGAGRDRRWLGLRVRPVQGWLYWLVAAAILGGIVLLSSLLFFVWIQWRGTSVTIPVLPPHLFWGALFSGCILAPILEELIYRLALCAPLAGRIGPVGTIVISGIVFGLLHWIYRNPAPDNMVAGFLLGWAYLKSGSIVVPMALHSGGNLFVFGMQAIHYRYPLNF
jgi:uncharacterized protein